ncbi:transposase [Streptomyces glaucescens]
MASPPRKGPGHGRTARRPEPSCDGPGPSPSSGINRLKQWRGIATRYEKTATIYLAGIHIAGIFLWSAR